MTQTATNKLIAARLHRDVGEPVGAGDGYGTRVPHFVPDDRCANALKIAVEALRKIESSRETVRLATLEYQGQKTYSAKIADAALAEINRIAEKGE